MGIVNNKLAAVLLRQKLRSARRAGIPPFRQLEFDEKQTKRLIAAAVVTDTVGKVSLRDVSFSYLSGGRVETAVRQYTVGSQARVEHHLKEMVDREILGRASDAKVELVGHKLFDGMDASFRVTSTLRGHLSDEEQARIEAVCEGSIEKARRCLSEGSLAANARRRLTRRLAQGPKLLQR